MLHVLLGFGTAIVYFVEGWYSAAIVFLIFALFYTICFISWRRRIPFATQILKFTMFIMLKYPSTLLVSLVGLLVTLAFGAWWSVSLVAAYVKYHPNSSSQNNPACNVSGGTCSSAALVLVLIFFSTSVPRAITNFQHSRDSTRPK